MQSRFAQDGRSSRKAVVVDDVVLRCHRADGDGVCGDSDFGHAGDVLKVDQVRDIGHAQFHHGDQAVAPRDDTRIVSVFF